MAELFRLDGVTVRDGEHVVLDAVDLVLPDVGLTVVVGPSGSGKTTLLRLLDRLEVPTAGTVTFRGRALDDIEVCSLRRRVAMVFQRPPVFGGSGFDNLRVARPDLGVAEAEEACRGAGLDPTVLERAADTLSGGEAQRLCLARALLTDPEVVLADEPTASLDGAAREAIEALSSRLAERGRSLVWVTHDPGQVRRLARHVVVLHDGRVRATGSLDALVDHPDPMVRASIGSDA
ncbi:MAG: ATP-binding cassette domain-containing protein [Acidimicrobiales bacterium]|nr:ATP-binding cassette domain-containing protein [Acidimicrobiales bacterium]